MAIKPGNSIHSDWVNANDQGDTFFFFFFTQTGKSKISNSKCMMWTLSISCIYTQKRLAEDRPIW